jgi:hypothetical protein
MLRFANSHETQLDQGLIDETSSTDDLGLLGSFRTTSPCKRVKLLVSAVTPWTF